MGQALRVLSDDEVNYVAGSSDPTIYVNGVGMSPAAFWAYYGVIGGVGGAVGDGGGGGGGGGTGSGEDVNPENELFTEVLEETAKEGLEDFKHDLEELIQRNGGHDFGIKIGDKVWSAKLLAESAGHLGGLLTVVQAGDLTSGLINGNKDYADVIGFLTALAVGAALPAEAPALAVIVATVGAGYLATEGSRAIGNMVAVAYQDMVHYVVNDSGVFQNVDPNQLPANQEINFFFELFGIPQGSNDPYAPPQSYNDPSQYYNSPYGYIDPALAAYYASLNPYGYYGYYG